MLQALLHSPLGILGTHAHAPGVSLSHWVQDSKHVRLHRSPVTKPLHQLLVQQYFFKRFLLSGTSTHQKERQRNGKREITPQWGWPRRNPFSSILLLGSWHARTRAWREFKPPGPGLEPRSTTWQSSDIAITLTAGPCLLKFLYLALICSRESFHQ